MLFCIIFCNLNSVLYCRLFVLDAQKMDIITVCGVYQDQPFKYMLTNDFLGGELSLVSNEVIKALMQILQNQYHKMNTTKFYSGRGICALYLAISAPKKWLRVAPVMVPFWGIELLMGITILVVLALLGIGVVIWKKQQGEKHIRHEKLLKKYKEQQALKGMPAISTFRKTSPGRFMLSANSRKKILRELKVLMDERRVYRQKGITLEKLARMQGTNRTYLSSVIRDEYGENFTCFINRYRIREAIVLLSDLRNNAPIKAIAENLGYQSLSTFYNAFNKLVNTSPSHYRKFARMVSPDEVARKKSVSKQGVVHV